MGTIRDQWQTLRPGLLTHYLRAGCERATSGITKGETRLHKITFSGNYGYNQIRSAVGPIKFLKDNTGNKKASYSYKYSLHKKDFYLVLMIGNQRDYGANNYMLLLPRGDISVERYRQILRWLNVCLPELRLSSIELATDLFCRSPHAVKRLFSFARRYVYLSYKRSISTLGGQKTAGGRKGYFTQIRPSAKIYERGADFKKQKGGGWLDTDFDRVRFEFTLNRPVLKGLQINSIRDLLTGNGVHSIINKFDRKSGFKFKYFKGSKQLPAFHEDYNTEDKGGYAGMIGLEAIAARAGKVNARQYLKDLAELDPLRERISEAMKGFERQWVSCT